MSKVFINFVTNTAKQTLSKTKSIAPKAKWVNGKWVKDISPSPVTSPIGRTLETDTISIGSTTLTDLGTKESKSFFSQEDIISKLGLKKTTSGYVFELNSDIKTSLLKQGNIDAIRLIKRLEKPLTNKNIEEMTKIMNEAAKVSDISEIEPFRLISAYRGIRTCCKENFPQLLENLTPERAGIIINLAKGDIATLSQINALTLYKNAGFTLINTSASNLAKANPKFREIIDDISSHISTQKIPAKTRVYRFEGYIKDESAQNAFGCINELVLDGIYEGKTLSQVMTEIESTTNPFIKMQKFNKLKDYIRKNSPTATNQRFMSTFLVNEPSIVPNSLLWEMDLKKGMEATFIDGLVINNSASNELELLLQRNSKLNIKDIECDLNTNAWKLKAEVGL